jgi:N-acetylneuraminic acid mutarotase
MYVLGGVVGGSIPTSSVLKFDSVQGTWSEVAPMSAAMWALASCTVRSDIYVFGGHNDQDFFKFDTEANVWSTLAPMPELFGNHTACVLGGLVYIVGDEKDVLRFDQVAKTWSTLTYTSHVRSGGVCFAVGGCLYATGGRENITEVERYDVTSNTWVNVANMLEARRYFGAVTNGLAEEQDLFDVLIIKSSGRCSKVQSDRA